MEQNKHDIIMFCMSDWHEWNKKGIVNRNRFILENLTKSDSFNKILAVDFLPYTKKRALRSFLDNQLFANDGKTINKSLISRLRMVSDKLFIYSTIYSAIGYENKIYTKINKFAKSLDFKNIILWSYFPMFCGYMNKINATLKVFDTVDNWMEHPNFVNYKERLKNNYNCIDKNSDLIFTVSKDLLDLYPYNNNVHWIPNGVDIDKFKTQNKNIKNNEFKLKNITKPVIGYVGIIQDRVDIEIIKFIAKNNPDKSIVMIGSVWPDANIKSLQKLNNIYFLGHKPYQEIPKYINKFDVAIIPHKINKFTESMNPMKLYEYLACGKPVITTPIAGLNEFKNLIKIASNKEEFNSKLNAALIENNEVLKSQRIKAAKKHSWKSRVDLMTDYINNFKK